MERDFEQRAKDLFRKIKQTDYPSTAINMIKEEFEKISEEEREDAIKNARVRAIISYQKKRNANGVTDA